ncbi:uncharacterized protein BP5553_00996 [Venustampulla echinocandica]|uniref:N-acetyltransferase domain-containing protein n=1 Tax=Venustampulla echinocandica TaxID=2656787 RepID=A0A370TZS6_9HELO|nr:uncharacterized protein BP5553_00996 [Venustampulla echinocandica]RDL41017.1 hypothetical protein BP5553_00996 [Venustampulla echinocandica]
MFKDAKGTSLPQTKSAGPQSSIKSFFKPRTPNYTPPPPPPLPTASPINAVYVSREPASVPSPALTAATPNIAPISPPTLPPQVTISLIQEQHIQPLRRINSLLLPIHYPDSFYHKILSPSPNPNFSRVIQWSDPQASSEAKVIGGIVCRLDPTFAPDSTPSTPSFVPGCYDIYIQSLALLSPYRSKGLAVAVLNDVISSVTTATLSADGIKIAEIYAHVWTENTEALEWYGKRGFKRDVQPVIGYYRRLNPDSAWILRRRILPSDHLQSQSTSGQTPQNGTTVSTTGFPAPLGISPASTPSTFETEEQSAARHGISTHARSFQERGPDREWNDLPNEILGNPLLKPHSHLGSTDNSSPSSRSSSQSRTTGKKKRVYPAAAFGA